MSDQNLGQLISLLKAEAIDAAEKEAEKILEKAKLQAQQLVQAAEEKRDTMITEAEREAQAILSRGESALRQAGRDYSISVRNELLKVFQAVLEKETRKEFTPDLLKTVIVKLLENIGSDVELKLSKEYSKELADYIHSRLKSPEQLVSIIEDNSVLNGFSITNKNQSWNYTISPEEVAEALKKHLNKYWINMLSNG